MRTYCGQRDFSAGQA